MDGICIFVVADQHLQVKLNGDYLIFFIKQVWNWDQCYSNQKTESKFVIMMPENPYLPIFMRLIKIFTNLT